MLAACLAGHPTPLATAFPPPLNLPQAVYKTYIDVVHIQKDEASNLFSMFSEETQSQEAELSQGNLADAPDTQVRPALLLHGEMDFLQTGCCTNCETSAVNSQASCSTGCAPALLSDFRDRCGAGLPHMLHGCCCMCCRTPAPSCTPAT